MKRALKDSSSGWDFWIDRGGTFTDVIAKKPDGSLINYKILSENKEQYDDATIYAIRYLLKIPTHQSVPTQLINTIKIGTTLATNALLEKKGEKTALVITKGFGDMLRIGYQNRPDIFALKIILPDLLYSQVLEVEERILASGVKKISLNLDKVRKDLNKLYNIGIRSLAIVLMHGYQFPIHEKKIVRIAKQIGFTQISTSHAVSPRIKIVTRGNMTVMDAYLTPLFKKYINDLTRSFRKARLYFMQSHGGLARAKYFTGKNSILSGPAAGVVAAISTCVKSGLKEIISFDMGGTSTDVAHFNGRYERVFESEIAGYKIQAPMLEIHSIASGGGSILSFTEGRFQVGPESAGANPGPTAYGQDGPLTVTDCHVLLGRIQPSFFPSVFGKSHQEALNISSVKKNFEKLLKIINKNSAKKYTAEQAAEGFLKIAVLKMANAIKKISTERGYDVSRYTLCCFGGAGAQHACQISDLLGIQKIFIHKYASVFSALGLGLAEIRIIKEQSIQQILAKKLKHQLHNDFKKLLTLAKKNLKEQATKAIQISTQFYLRLKYKGSDLPLVVPFTSFKNIKTNFKKIHKQLYGFVMPEKELVIDSIFIELIATESEIPQQKISFPNKKTIPKQHKFVPMFIEDDWQKIPLYLREELNAGNSILGPAIIAEKYTTIIIEPRWQAQVSNDLDILLEKSLKNKKRKKFLNQHDPVLLEIFNNLFTSVADQMGTILRQTAYSVNIKERLDYSCAIFDQKGKLIANAQHIPVHLGSMSESVQAIIKQNKIVSRGDVFLNNDPYHGGTHLPDITLISPVFINDLKQPSFYVASRGHHADIGGITPGSMPPLSKNIHEEGIMIKNFKVVSNGKFHEKEFLTILGNSPWPARNPTQNIADVQAQIAANQKGIEELQKLVEEYSLKTVNAYIKHMHKNAAESVLAVLKKLKNTHFSYQLDNGSCVRVELSVNAAQNNILIDFSGTSREQTNNFNTPRAVCRAAVLYVFRCLALKDIPLNEGILKPIKLILPKKSMLNPTYPAAIVAGNVETSQCIVDTLFGALGIIAAAQGTMNNFTFGDEVYQYYETLCGGSGAGAGFDGTDAVHTHMTNSRLTDPEVLESRFPIIIEMFNIRKNSGGSGKWHGGNGVIRKIHFLRPMTAAILSNRRKIPPYGLKGGKSAKKGMNWVIRANGQKEMLGSTEVMSMQKDDVFVIATPGGGGYGKK